MSISLNSAGSLVIQSSGTAANSKIMTVSAPTSLAQATTVNLYDPGLATTNLQLGAKKVITLVDNTPRTLLSSESGSLVLIPNIANATGITLPAVSAGLSYDFLVTGATAGAAVAISRPANAGNIVGGRIMTSNGANAVNGAAGALGASVTFAATAVRGDKISMFCDGTNWLFDGISFVTAGITAP